MYSREYIDRDLLMTCCANVVSHTIDPDTIMRLSVADVTPVVHGRWEHRLDNKYYHCVCSICEKDILRDYSGMIKKSNYCPNCGAKMDLEG